LFLLKRSRRASSQFNTATERQERKPMKQLILTLVACASLSACTVSVPVTAKTNTGLYFVGDCTGSAFGSNAKINAYSDSGLSVTANFNPWDAARSRTLHISFQVSDGRHGTAIVSMHPSGYGAMGVGKLNDGTAFKFFAGNSMPDHLRSEW
jgi:hypothetical protein